MTSLEPETVGELASDAIEASIVGDGTRVLDILQTLLVQGTKRDTLGFMVACMYIIACAATADRLTVAGPIQLLPSGAVIPTPGAGSTTGALLLSSLMTCYLAADTVGVRSLWVSAEDVEAAAAVGAVIKAGAAALRQRRAALN